MVESAVLDRKLVPFFNTTDRVSQGGLLGHQTQKNDSKNMPFGIELCTHGSRQFAYELKQTHLGYIYCDSVSVNIKFS